MIEAILKGDKGLNAYIITLVSCPAPPSGFYVPAVLFFDESEDLDIPSVQARVLRLA